MNLLKKIFGSGEKDNISGTDKTIKIGWIQAKDQNQCSLYDSIQIEVKGSGVEAYRKALNKGLIGNGDLLEAHIRMVFMRSEGSQDFTTIVDKSNSDPQFHFGVADMD